MNGSLLWMLLLGLSAGVGNADIVVSVSDVKPLPLKTVGIALTATELFRQSCPGEIHHESHETQAQVIVSFYIDSPHDLALPNGKPYASSGSLIRGAIDAWSQHQHLVLRPDVVWFEILAQINLYMTKHSEEVRNLFVSFQNKEEIVVRDLTWQSVIDDFKSEMQKRVKTKWLQNWISPGFSTSTENDNTKSTILMMGLMQQYFKFTGGIICGLPSVRLLGQRSDWAALQQKLDRLHHFGDEPAQYAKNLRPILQMFVKTWDNPKSPQVKAFWKQIVRANRFFSCGSGPIEYDVSGWITGFMHWTASGDLRVSPGAETAEGETKLDGIMYYSENLNQLPVGYAKAPLKMLDFPQQGTDSMAYVVAGNIGIARAQSGKAIVQAQPLSSWFLYGPVNTTTSPAGDVGSYDELERIYQGFKANCPGGYRKWM